MNPAELQSVQASKAGGGKGKAKGEAIMVGVRIRPMAAETWEQGGQEGSSKESFYAELDRTVLELDSSGTVVNSWSFDYVFGPTVSTSQIFDDLAMPVVEKAMDGFNGTIFAYGQTAAGKTFSMFGNEGNPGITTRAVYALFDKVKESKFSEYMIRGSYIELYNEDIKDLLFSDPNAAGSHESQGANVVMRIAEDPKTGPFVKGAVERVVERPEQILDLVKFGEKNRHYGATHMNERSSRSHVILRLVIRRGFVSGGGGGGKVVTQSAALAAAANSVEANTITAQGNLWHTNPKIPQRVSSLNFVDLAGSEKAKKTGATGAQLRESNAINKSLLTLGSVINRLSDGSPGQHVPYRDSKLTHLLSASLGGNASTAMLACISPTDYNREETQSTLRYASRAKKIVNVAEMNEVDNLESFMDSYWNEVDALRRQVVEAKDFSAEKLTEATKAQDEYERKLRQEKLDRAEEVAALEQKLKLSEDMHSARHDALRADLGTERSAHDATNAKLTAVVAKIQAELDTAHKAAKKAEEDGVALASSKVGAVAQAADRERAAMDRKHDRARQAMERAQMRLEELELFRMEEQQEFDQDLDRRDMLLEAKEAEIARLTNLLGDAPGQAEKLLSVTTDQEKTLLEREKRIEELEQKMGDMAQLANKVAQEAAQSREAASVAEERYKSMAETFEGDVEATAGQLLRDARARITELELALDDVEGRHADLHALHAEASAQHESSASELGEATAALEQLSGRLREETQERQRLRDENNMLRGRLRAMDKMGSSTVAAVLGLDEEAGGGSKSKGGTVSKSSLEAQLEQLRDRVSELEHENASLTAISADYRDHASEKLIKYENQVEKLQALLKETQEQMSEGETQRSLELRQELLALEELYTKDTTQLRVAYKELEAHHAERNVDALLRLGEQSPLVAEVLTERDQIKDKLGALQDEQTELMADLDKAVGKVADQDAVIMTLSDQLQELTLAIAEQGEDLRVLLEENGFLRQHIDRASRVAAAAALTRDKERSVAWTKEVSDLGASIQSSIADELRAAYDEVRSTKMEVVALREAMAAAQDHSVQQSHRMAAHLKDFRMQLDEVNDVEVRLADLHDQASAVNRAHEKMRQLEKETADYRAKTEARTRELEAAARPQEDIREVSLKSLPEGYILWYHSHVNPQVAALSEPENRDNLLAPHPKAYVSGVTPEGVILDIDRNVVAAELRSFPDLELQLESLVPEPLTERQFWVNYFSHKHGIKINVAEEADRLALEQGSGSRGFIQRTGASAHLRQQFVEAMRDAGVHLKLHQGTEVSDVVLWLKTPTELAWSTDLVTFPPPEHFTVPFFDVSSVTAGKESEVLRRGLAQWADPDCCFSFQLTDSAGGGTLDFEAGTRDETFTFIEGLHMLLKDAETNRGAPSYSGPDAVKAARLPYRDGGGGGRGGGSDWGGRQQGARNRSAMDDLASEHDYGPPPAGFGGGGGGGGYNGGGGGGGGLNGGGGGYNNGGGGFNGGGGEGYNNGGFGDGGGGGGGGYNGGGNGGGGYNGGGGGYNGGGGGYNGGGGGYNGGGSQYGGGSHRGGGDWERWLGANGLDMYVAGLDQQGVSSLQQLAGFIPGQAVEALAERAGMRPNDAIKLGRLQAKLRH